MDILLITYYVFSLLPAPYPRNMGFHRTFVGRQAEPDLHSLLDESKTLDKIIALFGNAQASSTSLSY